MSKTSRGVQDKRLVCRVVSLTYDFNNRAGELFLAEGDCCDMGGCVSIFEGIDPKATTINTRSGGDADTMYRKNGDKWAAVIPGKPAADRKRPKK